MNEKYSRGENHYVNCSFPENRIFLFFFCISGNEKINWLIFACSFIYSVPWYSAIRRDTAVHRGESWPRREADLPRPWKEGTVYLAKGSKSKSRDFERFICIYEFLPRVEQSNRWVSVIWF